MAAGGSILARQGRRHELFPSTCIVASVRRWIVAVRKGSLPFILVIPRSGYKPFLNFNSQVSPAFNSTVSEPIIC